MRVIVSKDFSELSAFITQIPRLMEDGGGEMVYEGRNRVVRFRQAGRSLIVKRYKKPLLVQRFAYTFFRKSKAERAFLFAEEFLRRGIDTPAPVAFVECSVGGLLSMCYFVSVESEGVETSQLLREVADYPGELAEAVAKQVLEMHHCGVLHGDLNLSNFLCTVRPEGYHFTMIDTNRSHFCQGMPTDKQCMENMIRLTHRRDLYEDLIRRYARLREWDEEQVATNALRLLNNFEHRRFKL